MDMQRLPSRGNSSVSTMSDVGSLDDVRLYSQVDAEKYERNSLEAGTGEADGMLSPPQSASQRHGKKAGTSRYSRTKLLVIILASFVLGVWLMAASFYFFSGTWKKHSHAPIAHKRRISFDDARSGRFAPQATRVDWTQAHGEDGMYLIHKHNKISLVSVNGSSQTFLDENDLKVDTPDGEIKLPYKKFWISPDMEYVLFATDLRANWRYSFYAIYWVYEVGTKRLKPLVPDNVNAVVGLAIWAPVGHSLSYVLKNDLYVRHDLGEPKRLTVDGGENIFNGIPDWVYEEEIFQGNSATWWAPDGRSLAYLKTDEHPVTEYPLEYFISPEDGDAPPEIYPEIEQLKYPKPGTLNPRVSLHFYDLENEADPQPIVISEDFGNKTKLITEVKWFGSEKLFIRETNRDSVIQKTIIAEPRKARAEIIEQLDVHDIDDGWFEVSHNTHYIPASPAHGRPSDGYVDVVISAGYLHLALFSPVGSKTPKMLTSGEWEVVSGTQAIDLERDLIYFLATKKSSLDRHLYSVSLSTGEMRAVTDDSKDGYYLTSFSPKAGYYVLGYAGPGLPWEKLCKVDDPTFSVTLEDNAKLQEQLDLFDLPQKVYSTITIDGYEMNTVELRPPNFDASGATKYPVLFRPYGGPISQTVNHQFAVDWHSWLASDPTTEYLVVAVDGRGTGFMGRKLRVPVRGQLGRWEAHDQIEAAKLWKKKSYTDPGHFAIWGWSFGGFLTLKVLEAGSSVFQYGMAVAPVTDWRFYDSVYTERYMGTIEDNLKGYENTAITHVDGFRNATRFMVMHGTGDDNVHFQNTLAFVDRLNVAEIENYDMHVFPDSDHGIYFHGANKQVYHRLGQWLKNAFGTRNPLAEDRSWKGHIFTS